MQFAVQPFLCLGNRPYCYLSLVASPRSMVPSSTCDEDRAILNLRLDWFWQSDVEGIDVRRNLMKCPDVRDSMVLAEVSWLLKRLNQLRTYFRFNTSNHTHMTNDWRYYYMRTMRHVSAAEKILENLLLKSSLFYFFHPAQLGTGLFFNAASLMRRLLTILPLMLSKDFRALSLSQRPSDSFWHGLEAGLLRDVALDVALPDTPEPCTLLAALQDLLVADGLRIEAGSDWSGALGREIRRSLDSAQQQLVCMHKHRGGRLLQHFMFPKAFVFFLFLDRLDCRKVAAIKANLLGQSFLRSNKNTFWMHVLPARHIESNHVRGKGDFHCGCTRLIVEQLEQSTGDSFRFVEVGASLGGCSWRVLTSNDRAFALAVEPYKPAADAMKRTAFENGLAYRFTVYESLVSAKSRCPGIVRNGFAHKFVDQYELKRLAVTQVENDCKTRTLSDILYSWSPATVDLLRIHANGFEMDVLRSAAESLHKIRALAIAMWTYRDFPQAYDPAAIIQLLLDSGCTARLHCLCVQPRKSMLPEMKELHNQEVVSALTKSEILTRETMTLMAFCGEKCKDLRSKICLNTTVIHCDFCFWGFMG